MPTSEQRSEKIQTCRELYLKYEGNEHERIEQDMRDLGYKDFHRRCLYRRFERDSCKPGWIETYGWDALLKDQLNAKPLESEPPPSAVDGLSQPPAPAVGKSSPPYEGGVAAASADGVVLRSAPHTTGTSASSSQIVFDEFKQWLKKISPASMTWDFKHQVQIYKALERVHKGESKRLMLFMPPRHGKSELVTVRYTAFCLKQDPSKNIIIGSYNQDLANRFSRKIKRVLTDDWTCSRERGLSEPPASAGGQFVEKKAAPGSRRIVSPNVDELPSPSPPAHAGGSDSVFPFIKPRPKNSEAEWETTKGGGLRAVGVGAGVTGFGADLIIIDDPVKSRAEAESQTYRDNLWEWFNDDIYTRLEPDGKIILIQTRWHEDDLAGRLLKEMQNGGEKWDVVDLPALAEATEAPTGAQASLPASLRQDAYKRGHNSVVDSSMNITPEEPAFAGRDACAPVDILGRTPGEALWPERFNEIKLEKIKRKLGTYSFSALYQQKPAPAEGGTFRREWFQKVIDSAPDNLSWKRGYDLAVSTKQTADYTASFRCAKDKLGNLYIADGFRARLEYPDQRRYILGRMREEPRTEHGIEAALHGRAMVQDLRRSHGLGRFAFRSVKVDADKLTRALTWLNLADEGRVYLVRGPWIDDFLDEISRFPTGTHDDQIDAISVAVQMIETKPAKLWTF